jgi:NADH:ubiquinone oxidoreductase subunit C
MVTVLGSAITGVERNTEKTNTTTNTMEILEKNFFIHLSPYVGVHLLKYDHREKQTLCQTYNLLNLQFISITRPINCNNKFCSTGRRETHQNLLKKKIA